MDQKTEKRLQGIGQALPMDLIRSGVITEKPFVEEREKIVDMSKRRNLTLREKKELHVALASEEVYNSSQREITSIDPKVGEEIKGRVDAQIRQDMRKGKLKKARTDDPFHKMIEEKWHKK